MAKSLAGVNVQVAIIGHLTSNRFTIQEEEEWDHNNKIDFVVTKFPRYPKSVALGVQLTTWCGNGPKLNEFVAKNDPASGSMVANKAIYLEIGENVDINKGGADLVAQILYAFQFDEQFADAKVWGATILTRPDSIAYRFFDPRKTMTSEPPPVPIGACRTAPISNLSGAVERLEKSLVGRQRELEGRLNTYYTDRGYGYISAQDGRTFYLHIKNVKDASLSSDLNALMKFSGPATPRYHVLFEDGGKTRADAAYPSAQNIRLMLKC